LHTYIKPANTKSAATAVATAREAATATEGVAYVHMCRIATAYVAATTDAATEAATATETVENVHMCGIRCSNRGCSSSGIVERCCSPVLQSK